MKPKIKASTAHHLPLAVDSGAYSLYTKYGAHRTKEGKIVRGLSNVDQEYHSKPEFKRYFEDYMEFVSKYHSHFVFCVSLDVLGSEEKTWELYQEMTRQGLKVMPVIHRGEQLTYLKRYMDSTDYIGFGGLVKTGPSLDFRTRLWKALSDNKGRPLLRTHAFGLTSFEPMQRHPYYSVDSTTSFTWSRYGCIMMPAKKPVGQGFDFRVIPKIRPVTPGRSKSERHIDHTKQSGREKEAMETYLAGIGLTLEDVSAPDGYGARDVANLYFMNQTMLALAEKHSSQLGTPIKMLYYASGNFSSSLPIFNAGLTQLQRHDKIKQLGYLGTFNQLGPLVRLCNDWLHLKLTPGKSL